MNKLLFEIITKDGHKYKLYANGHSDGFPEGSVMINHAGPLINSLRAEKEVAQ